MRARSAVLTTTCVAAMAVIAACGNGPGGDTMQPTITAAEANRRVEEYATKVREALPANAIYELYASEEHGDCSDPSDNGARGRVIASRSYQIHGLPADQIPASFDALRGWWQSHNFRVLDNNPPNEFLWVENNGDAFRMTLKANSAGELFVIATSPCVWPDGTPTTVAAGSADDNAAAPVAQAPASVNETKPAMSSRPRRARPPVDDEDFDQTDWTDEGLY